MLAPEHPSVFPGQGDDLLGDLPDQRLSPLHLHVDGGPHVQHTGIDVTEHAIDETAPVEGGAELGDVVG